MNMRMDINKNNVKIINNSKLIIANCNKTDNKINNKIHVINIRIFIIILMKINIIISIKMN